jgi:hypothetical protein
MKAVAASHERMASAMLAQQGAGRAHAGERGSARNISRVLLKPYHR